MVPRIEETKKVLQNAFDNLPYFTFIRIGDGDLVLIAGQGFEQRHKNSPKLKEELTEVIKIVDDKYLVSSTAGTFDDGSGSYFWLPKNIQRTLDRNLKKLIKQHRPEGIPYHALVFQYCLEHQPEWFVRFFKDNLRDKRVLFIAGDGLCGKPLVEKVFNISDTISFPGLDNSYYRLKKRMDNIRKRVEQVDVVIPCLGMGTRVLAKKLWKEGFNKIVIDVGVSIDALARADHRGWTQRMIREGFVSKIEAMV